MYSLSARVSFQLDLPGETCMKLTSEDSIRLSGYHEMLSLKVEKGPLAISSSMTQEWGVRLYDKYQRANNLSKSKK